MKAILAALTAVAALLCPAGEVKYLQQDGKIQIDHPDFQCTVSAVGGQITSFITRNDNRELVNSVNPQLDGLGKLKDGFFADLTPQSAEYELNVVRNADGSVAVTADLLCGKGVFKGIKILRTFTFEPDKDYIAIRESLEAVNAAAELYPEFHNSVSAKGLDAGTFFASAGGGRKIGFDLNTLNQRGTQAVHSPSAPWFGYVDDRSGSGFALLFDNTAQLDCYFAWKGGQHLVLSAKGRKIKIEPTAELDLWQAKYTLLPFRGHGRLLFASRSLVVCGQEKDKSTQFSVYFPEAVSGGEVYIAQGDRTLAAAPVKAGQKLYTLTIPSTKGEVKIGLRGVPGAFAATCTGDAGENAYAPAEKSLPKRNAQIGVYGNYYYYKELYLSRTYPVWVSFGVNGDLRRKKELRFGLILPKEVKLLAVAPRRLLGQEEFTLDGVPMIRYELEVFRAATRYNAMEVCLQIDGELKPGAVGAVQAYWKGGAQEPEKFKICEVAGIPKLPGKLQYFTLGMQYRRDINLLPVENFGFNVLLIPRREEHYSSHQGEGFHQEMLDELKRRGIVGIQSYLEPYKIMEVVAGNKGARQECETLFHPEKHKQKVDFDSLNARDIHGAIAADVKKRKLACPLMVTQGAYAEKTRDYFKTAIDYGYNNFAVDGEHWTNGNTICFCKHCEAEFQKRVKAAELPAVDLKTVARENQKYPRHYAIWWDMKTDQVAEVYRQIREVIDSYKPLPDGRKRKLLVWVDERVSLTDPYYSAITNRLTDHRKLAQYADELLPMCYEADARLVTKTAQLTSELIKGRKAKTVMGLSPNRTYEYLKVVSGNLAPLKAFEQQILESYFHGAKGVMTWSQTAGFRGAYDYLNAANAVLRMLPIEEIVYFGSPVEVKTDNPAVTVTALEYKGKIAVFLREYSSKDIEFTLMLPKGFKNATDTFTGKKLDSLKLNFSGEDRIHTLLLEP